MSAFGQSGFGSKNRQNQLRAQGQMDPFGQQVRQAMQPPTLNIYQAPQSTAQAQTGGTAQPAPAVNMTAQAGGTFPTKPVTPGTAQAIQPQPQGTQYGSDPTHTSRVAAAAQEWNSTPAGSQQRDWAGNTMSKMPPEMAAQWQSMQSGQGGLGAGNISAPDPNAVTGNVIVGYGVGSDGVTMRPIYGPDPGRLTNQSFAAQPSALPFLPSVEMTQRVQSMPVPTAVAAAGAEAVANWRNSQLSELNTRQAQDHWNQYNESRVLDPSLPLMTLQDFQNPEEGPVASGAISGAYGIHGPFNVNLTNEQILPPWMRTKPTAPGAAQPIQPQSQGTQYREDAEWDMPASPYGTADVDPSTGLARPYYTAEQAEVRDNMARYGTPMPPDAYARPPQDESIVEYLRQRDAGVLPTPDFASDVRRLRDFDANPNLFMSLGMDRNSITDRMAYQMAAMNVRR